MKKIVKKIVFIMIILFLGIGLYSSVNATKTATVNTTALNVRSGPSTSYDKIGSLSKGTVVEILSESNGWAKIEYGSGKTGYVSSKYLTIGENNNSTINQGKTATVNTTALNVRSGPGTSYSKVGSLTQGTIVKIISESNGWAKIEYGSGKTGYVSSKYLTIGTVNQNYTSGNYEVIVTKLNVRQSASSTSGIIGSLAKGNKLNIISTVNGWYKISFNGGYGYVSPAYMKKYGDSNYVITVNITNNTLKYEYNGNLVNTYSVATGKSSTPTPTGVTVVCNKIVNRPYYKEGIPGGSPENPLGRRWIGIDINNTNGQIYAIHGNNNESSIGYHVSGGCIRMHNYEIEEFYDRVAINTKVVIQK